MKYGAIVQVKGKLVDEQTRCVHYHSAIDVIAIKFKCCNEYYACHSCHDEEAGHQSKLWAKVEFGTKAILCGMCRTELSIDEYLQSNNHCPVCNAAFNPNCSRHYNLYFEI